MLTLSDTMASAVAFQERGFWLNIEDSGFWSFSFLNRRSEVRILSGVLESPFLLSPVGVTSAPACIELHVSASESAKKHAKSDSRVTLLPSVPVALRAWASAIDRSGSFANASCSWPRSV